MKKKLLVVLLILFVAALFVACTPDLRFAEAKVQSITVGGITRTEYVQGDDLDVTDATVIVTYTDGKIAEYPLTADMLSGYNMNAPEIDKVVTVTYGGKKTTFNINVYDLIFASVRLDSAPLKREYVVGEEVRAQGARLAIVYEGGKTVYTDVTDKMLENYDNTRVGSQQIYISYYGNRLSFYVNFIDKTITGLTVLREPNQSAVFVGYGDRLELDGMRLKLAYDNELTPEVSALEIRDNLHVYIDDRYVRTEIARVAYLPDDYPTEITYTYSGEAMVRQGEYVTPTTELAGNGELDNVVSKSYGVVKYVGKGSLTVSTVVTYPVTEHTVSVGKILLFEESIGRYGGTNVYASAGGGIVTSIEEGVVTVQTLPVGQFSINVQDRSYQSMVVTTYPVTKQFRSAMDDVTQGDSIDLSSGSVTVTYNNGEVETYPMDHTLIKVVNSDDDLLRSEIPGFEFTSIDNVSGLPAGRYELLYGVSHGYPEDRIKIVVTVISETGENLYVQENRYVSLNEGTNYTVSISATLTEGGEKKVTECVYYLATVGAGVRRSQLDITAAGEHVLNVVYGGVKNNSIEMRVRVIQRYPVSLDIVPESDNISGKTFWMGDTIPLTTIRYVIRYNNLDVSEELGVTSDMLSNTSNLACDDIGTKEITFVIPGTTVESAPLSCEVVAVPIRSVVFMTDPTDAFLTAPAANGSNDVNLSGATLRVYYENGSVAIIGREAENELTVLKSNMSGQRVVLTYPDSADQPTLEIDDIYEHDAHHTATLTYYDSYGASADCEFRFYVIPVAASSIRMMYRAEYYKDTYIQCEDWDLTGITLSINWANNTTETRPATLDMIYDSTTDEVGQNIPFKFKFLGKIDATTLKINVKPRQEVALSVKQTGKDTYTDTDRDLDLTRYRFSLTYNAGASAEILGVSSAEMTGSRTSQGWWYELFDSSGNRTQFRRIGTKTVRLYHTSIFESEEGTVYNIVYTDFVITVSQNNTDIAYISYDDVSVGEHEGLRVLSETPAGWELFLSEFDPETGDITAKYLTVHYVDGTVGYVDIQPEMLDYNSRVTTLGYTKVKLTYKGFTTTVLVHVRNAELSGVVVEKKPVTNFIAGSKINLVGGILKITFTINELIGGEIHKYLYLDDDQITTTGFNSNIDPEVDHVMQEITVRFRDKAATYVVTIYNKQPIRFIYQNTIFFYGNTKSAVVTPLQLIPEFDLPDPDDILLWYVENSAFIPVADFADYLLAHTDMTEGDFMRVISIDGDYYVPRSALSRDYYIEPANTGYDYYILMEVGGNDYYRAENYALQTFTIIPKVIEVTAVNYTENAFVKPYKNSNAHDNAMAVYYLYRKLSAYVADLIGGKINSVEMLSPNASGFEIAVFVTADFDYSDPVDKEALDAIFAEIEYQLTRNEGLRVSTTGEVRRGINIGEYNGVTPEYVSYRVAAGETLTRRNGLGEDILELLSGSLSFGDAYDYGVGERNITVGTLGNKNYNVDFAKGVYLVLPRAVEDFSVTPSGAVSDLSSVTVMLNYVDGGYRYVKGDDKELFYYTDAGYTDLVDGLPTESGTYYVRVGKAGAFVDAEDNTFDIKFTIQYIKE